MDRGLVHRTDCKELDTNEATWHACMHHLREAEGMTQHSGKQDKA